MATHFDATQRTWLTYLYTDIDWPTPKQTACTRGQGACRDGSSEQGSCKSKGSVINDSITVVEPR